MASPIDSWEGVEAYFTFADSPMMLGFILFVSIVVTVIAIGATMKHEAESYKDYKE